MDLLLLAFIKKRNDAGDLRMREGEIDEYSQPHDL
jgi:hypothetical protein